MEQKDAQTLIKEVLSTKGSIKQKVFDNTQKCLGHIKEVSKELQEEINSGLKKFDKRVKLEYKDRGEFESELKVAGDVLIFSMHSNIFDFDHSHKIHQLNYVRKNRINSYCGIIHIYNFLTDSFKYSRLNDLGYLIARIFINCESHFFVEGKRQLGFLYNDFGNRVLDRDTIKEIIQSAILYSLEFELLVPPYDNVSIVSVEHMLQKFRNPVLKTGKRLGFHFSSEDIRESQP